MKNWEILEKIGILVICSAVIVLVATHADREKEDVLIGIAFFMGSFGILMTLPRAIYKLRHKKARDTIRARRARDETKRRRANRFVQNE